METKDPGQLEHASNRLKYHIDMFRGLAKLLRPRSAKDDLKHKAMVESFAINVRALIVFFFEKPNEEKGDAAATHFVHKPDAWRTNYNKGRLKEGFSVLDEARERANKGVAHITFSPDREEPLGRGYPVNDISNELELVSKAFLEDVDEDRLGERWDGWKKRNSE